MLQSLWFATLGQQKLGFIFGFTFLQHCEVVMNWKNGKENEKYDAVGGGILSPTLVVDEKTKKEIFVVDSFFSSFAMSGKDGKELEEYDSARGILSPILTVDEKADEEVFVGNLILF